MHEAQQLLPFWLNHPNIVNRPKSATIYDVFLMMMGSVLPVPQNDEEREEARDSLTPLPGTKPSLWYTSLSLPEDNRAETPERELPHTAPSNTPIRIGTRSSVTDQNGEVVNKALQAHLQDVFSKHMHRDVPIVDYIKLVYNFEPIQIPKKRYTIPRKAYRAFCKAPNEKASYPHIEHIFKALRNQLYQVDTNRPLDLHWIAQHDRTPKSNYSKFRPDFFDTANGLLKQLWDTGSAIGEVKREKEMNPRNHPLEAINLEKLLKEAAMSTCIRRSKRKAAPALEDDVPGRKRARTAVSDDAAPSSLEMIPARTVTKRKSAIFLPEPTGPSSKRLCSEDRTKPAEDAAAESSTSSPPADLIPLTLDQLQAAKYLQELLSHGVRSYATGWLLQDTTMTLCYADRMGLIHSATFDIFEEPHYLLLLVAATTFAEARDMGFCHFIKVPAQIFNDYGKTNFEVDEAETDNGPVEDLKFKIVDVDDMHTEYGAVCRGTTIIPVQPIGSTAEKLGIDVDDSEKLIAKISWPPAVRTPEAMYIKKIRRSLRESRDDMLKHIVDVKCSLTRTMAQVDLPRAFMGFRETDGFDTRELRCLVMKRYEPLQMVNNAEEFKTVFIDVVRAHHCIYEETGILHRDVSVGNVMFYRLVNNRVVGVMCDWDQATDTTIQPAVPEKRGVITKPTKPETDTEPGAQGVPQTGNKDQTSADSEHVGRDVLDGDGEHTPDDQETKPLRPNYRTGTGPFMACGLLHLGEIPPHEYRFDLESFFWLLAWFCATFDQNTHSFARKCSWDVPDLFNIGEKKRTFLGGGPVFDSTYKGIEPAYGELVGQWIIPLRWLFKSVTEHENKLLAAKARLAKAETFGHHHKLEEFRQNLANVKSTMNRDVATYEQFMRRLGLEE